MSPEKKDPAPLTAAGGNAHRLQDRSNRDGWWDSVMYEPAREPVKVPVLTDKEGVSFTVPAFETYAIVELQYGQP